MKRFLVALTMVFLTTAAFAEGGKMRSADEVIDEVHQLCQQVGAGERTTVTVEECVNEGCILIKVDCSLAVDTNN